MEALLSSIASASDDVGGSGNPSCASFADLESQFRDLASTKVTEKKVEHIEVTFEFTSTVIFDVSNSDAVPEVAGSPVNIDPALTQIRAQDVLMSQPQDDPVAQRTIAKHVLHALGQVDGTSWAVRSMSRASQGWTFTYNCQQSMQTWQRQHGKEQRGIVGESSGKDGIDKVNLSRPAYDCRGIVTIAFNRPLRAITVKYEHTPLHKTVAELAELYKRPPAPSAKSATAKRKADGAPEGSKKKKRKSEKAAAGGEAGANGVEFNEDGTPVAKPERKRPPRPKKKKAGEDGGAQGAYNPDPAAVPAMGNSLLNLPPGEAARRSEMASQLLRGSGLDPETLSTEQFNIFANQSPDLQRESLNLLVEYGAERLRIVHPLGKGDSSSTSTPATPTKGANGALASPQFSAAETPDTSAKKKKSRKKKSEAIATEDISTVDGALSVQSAARKRGETRGKCEGCKARKVNCSKGRPSCDECLQAGNSCYYAPVKSKSRKSTADDEAQDEVQEEVQDEQVEEEEPEGLPSPGFSQPVVPENVVEEAATPEDLNDPYHTTAAGWNQSNADMSYDNALTPAGMYFSQVNPQTFQETAAAVEVTMAQQQVQPASLYQTETPALATPTQPTSPRETRSSTRRTLPSAAPQAAQSTQASSHDAAASAWQNLPHAASPPAPLAVSPKASYRKQHRSLKSATVQPNQGFESLQQAASMTQAPAVQQPIVQQAAPQAAQQTVQQPARSLSAAQQSPFQAPTQVARAKSRQAQRSQSRTPVNPNQPPSLRPQNPPTQTVPDMNSFPTSAAPDASAMSSFDSYGRYSGTTNDQSASRVAYQPYHNTASTSTAQSGSNVYNNRSSTAYSTPVTQNVSSGYTTATAPSTGNQWSSAQQQSRSSTGYGTGSSTASTSGYSAPAAQSATLDYSRAQSSSVQGRRTPTTYNQQPQQQQRQQMSQQQQFPYSSQSATAASGQQQQQENWYGLGGTNHNAATNPNYNTHSQGNTGTSGYASTGSHNHSAVSTSYGQHHRSMNLTGHTYNMGNQEPDLYDLLRNSHS